MAQCSSGLPCLLFSLRKRDTKQGRTSRLAFRGLQQPAWTPSTKSVSSLSSLCLGFKEKRRFCCITPVSAKTTDNYLNTSCSLSVLRVRFITVKGQKVIRFPLTARSPSVLILYNSLGNKQGAGKLLALTVPKH